MEKKIIFLDLDGTLTNDEKIITPKTKEALIKIQEEGHVVALCSGRPTPGMVNEAKELRLDEFGGYVISFNGGRITNWKTKEDVACKCVPKKYLKPLLDFANEKNIGMITYDDVQVIVGTRMDEYIEKEAWINKINTYETDLLEYVDYDPVKCLMTAEPNYAAKCEEELKEIFKDQLTISRSAAFFIEITPKGIDKAASIETLINHLGIEHKNTIACGDGYNDMSMVKYAYVGVAMENAVDEVKEVANYITASNNEDGIAQVIKEFF